MAVGETGPLTTEAGAPVADNNTFRHADADYGKRLDAAVQALRG